MKPIIKHYSCSFLFVFAIGICTLNSSSGAKHEYEKIFLVPFNDGQYEKISLQDFLKMEEVNKSIDIMNPDYDLLAAAVFYATNEYRQNKNLPLFKYSRDLRDACDKHSRNMCDSGFFGHNNRKDTANYTPRQRIKNTGGRYFIVGENLSRTIIYKVTNAKDYYAMKGENISGSPEFKFFDKKVKEELPTETYIEFGRKTVKQWTDNKAYLANLLSLHFSHCASSVAFPKEPYKKKNLPLGLVTQNFGGYILN
ncbi:MAG: CAP domain-containing protein [Bacteroidota bacterium]